MPSQPNLHACSKTTGARVFEDAVECERRPAIDQESRQLGLAVLDRRAPEIVAIEAEQIKGAKNRRVSMLAPAK